MQSLGIQLATFAPVSHARLYLGEGRVAAAVGEGAGVRSIGQVLDSEAMVVAFRDPQPKPAQGTLRDACVRGFATVQLGASSEDRFYCPQFVLGAYRQAGASLSDVDPRWVSLADLLHMRDGDVATLAAARPLRYAGHLEYTAPKVAVNDAP